MGQEILHVLLIDDVALQDREMQSVIAASQDDSKFTLLMRAQMEGALFQAAVKQTPNLILLAIGPDCDGWLEILRKIKTDAHLQNIPVIAYADALSEADKRNAYKYYVNALIQKPAQGYPALIAAIKPFWFQTSLLPRIENLDNE